MPWFNDTLEATEMPEDYEMPLLGAFLFYFVQVFLIHCGFLFDIRKACWDNCSLNRANTNTFGHDLESSSQNYNILSEYNKYIIIIMFTGLIWYGVRCGTLGEHARHLRRPTLHQDANCDQSVHSQPSCRRWMFPHWYSVHYDDNGSRLLAVWQRHVQGNGISLHNGCKTWQCCSCFLSYEANNYSAKFFCLLCYVGATDLHDNDVR